MNHILVPARVENGHRFGTFSAKLAAIPGLAALLGGTVVHLRSEKHIRRDGISALVGWGQRPTTHRPRAIAARLGLAFIAVEDGFLRSYGTAATHPALSLVLDESGGVYYDARHPSALETLLASDADVLSGPGTDTARARARIVQERLSKYNFAPDFLADRGVPLPEPLRILVVDQTRGDASIECGLANADTFATMLTAARSEHPDAILYVKTHPEVSNGAKAGHYSAVQADAHTVLLHAAVSPLSLLAHMDRVYVVTSQLGFEALLAGVPVTCFGAPWYAGWGVTDDRTPCPRRHRARSVDELFAAAYLHCTRYLNPETHTRGTIFDVIDWLSRQRRMASAHAGRTIAIGYRRWKADNVRPILAAQTSSLHFVVDANAAALLHPTPQDCLVVWGVDTPAAVTALAQQSGAALARMEDGFIRSVGLGSDFIAPQSLVLDTCGLYLDPRAASNLETLLNTHAFTDADCTRAARVRALINQHQISKYNVEPHSAPAWGDAAGRARAAGHSVVLVPGQVEDDASIRYGCESIRTNLVLLAEVRRTCPAAFIVYKPHPDVLAGKRTGQLHHDAALRYANAVETQTSIVACIAACDAVYTLTSLAGFDALVRGKPVTVYGRPFYAGWGLTRDHLEHPRRTRTLTLNELIAGTLLHYPLYWDWTLQGFTTCEATLLSIVRQRKTARLGHHGAKNRLARYWHTFTLWARAGFMRQT